jgi:TIR domain
MNEGADRQRDLAVAETTLKGKRAAGTFDVFLSYRTADRERVIEIAERLMKRGILPWLDIWEIAPGERWQDCLAQQIGNIRAVAVLIGSPDLGPWQDLEQQAFISQFVKRGCRVVPVFLPGTAPDVTLPLLLEQWHAVDFRQRQPDPFEQLVWGITGERPQDR